MSGPALAAATVAVLLTGSAAPPQRAYVDVAAATVWTSPDAPRSIDRPALTNPVDLRAWSRSLGTAARRGLVGRIQTQALYGEPVQVLGRRRAWTHVAVVDYGTRVPVIGTTGSDVVVATPDGHTALVGHLAVSTFARPGDRAHASGRDIVRAARMFLGVRYLWGGASAFGFDCSGLIELAFRTAGFVIPRDADAQAHGGHTVSRTEIRPGDLLFFGRSHVHHVTLYIGDGRMIEAPNSASTVRISPVRLTDYAGARRYLHP